MDYGVLIAYLRQKRELTDLEKDILDTADELQKNPFVRHTAEMQVRKNNAKYPKIYEAIAVLPTTTVRPFCEVSDSDIRYGLNCQLDALLAKEMAGENGGNG